LKTGITTDTVLGASSFAGMGLSYLMKMAWFEVRSQLYITNLNSAMRNSVS
jgi:hypothetical protein